MPFVYNVSTVTIPISARVSETFQSRNGTLVGMWVPIVASTANLFIQVSPDTTSANFVRARVPPPNSGDYTISAQAGSFGVSLVDVTLGFQFLRIETLVSETASRAFVLTTKG